MLSRVGHPEVNPGLELVGLPIERVGQVVLVRSPVEVGRAMAWESLSAQFQ